MILFLKSYVRAHKRTLADGTVVQVAAHHTKTTAGIAAKDDRTPDMFKPTITAANRPTPLPLDAAKHPEKYTPDMFTGETAVQTVSGNGPVRDALNEGDRVQLDVQAIRRDRNMFTLDRTGQPSPAAVRTIRILEEILSRTKNRPFVTRASVHHDNIEDEYVEIATGTLDSDERVMTLTVPKKAVLAVDTTKASPIMVIKRNEPAKHRGADIHGVIQPTSGSELKQEQQAMSTSKIAFNYSGHNGEPEKAESDRFVWRAAQGSYLHDKLVDKSIYQMSYLRATGFGSDPVDDATKTAAREFLASVHAESDRAKKLHREISEARLAKEESEREYPRDEAKARAYDNIHNEGFSDGYNPYR